MSKQQTIVRSIELRAVAKQGENSFEGLACKYGVVDAYGTTFMPNCFTRGGLDDTVYAFLWMHDPSNPVGTFTAEERADGLYIVGKWDDTTAGRDARAAAMSGSASDLSVGFTWYKEDGAEDNITIARLTEVSQVTTRFGAVPGSALTAARAVLMAEDVRAGRVLSSSNEEALRAAVELINAVLAQTSSDDSSEDQPDDNSDDGARWTTEYTQGTPEHQQQGTPEAEEFEQAVEAGEVVEDQPAAEEPIVEDQPVSKKRAAQIEALARYIETLN